ncbi:MAG: 3-isopropylmalate dehydrogenase [Ignavibacteriales bacterium]|nr:3-isopropylmalate dehydrogenase [Ignavibacteriales bacterium]MCB9210551.1 3-isopropylmalate dehydrogenase [Ignavibacteriales bacterium]
MNYKIALLPGDGIGPEVTNAAVKIMNLVAEKFNVQITYETYDIGGGCYEKHGTPLVEETLEGCYKSDAVFLGAVGGPNWEKLPHHLKPEAALLKLREQLGLFANIRPARIYPSMLNNSTLKREVLEGTDFIVLRELTGGIYFGKPRGIDENKGWNTMVYNTEEVERIAIKAFEAARKRDKVVTSVDKANVLEVSQFWRNVVEKVHKDFSDIKLNHMYVDNAAMQIVRDPKQFDVILTSNIFGDILSDISGMITGSLGMLPSASIGEKYSLYEPVHGSAPDIAGQNKANPIAAISSAAMLFDYSFDMTKAAEIIEKGITQTLQDGYRTADIAVEGNKIVSTTEMTELISEKIQKIFTDEAIGVFLL